MLGEEASKASSRRKTLKVCVSVPLCCSARLHSFAWLLQCLPSIPRAGGL